MKFASHNRMTSKNTGSTSFSQAALFFVALFALSCSHTGATETSDVSIGEFEVDWTPPPQSVVDAVMPPMEHTTDLPTPEPPKVTESRFDVHVNEAPGAAFFLSLVENTPYSVVLHPEIGGEISLALKDATLNEVLSTVQDVYGYEIERNGNRIYVMPAGLRTQVFELNYLNLDRRGQSQTWVSSGQITDKVSGGESGGSETSGKSSFSSGSSIATINGSDIWKELVQSVRSIIGTGEGRSVVTNPNAGMVVVRGMPWELREVGSYLDMMEKSLNRQVIIEARILEVTLSDKYQAGVNWSQLIDKDGFETTISQTGGGTTFDGGTSSNAGNTGNLHPSATSEAAAAILDTVSATSFGGVFGVAIQASHFTALIELLKNQGEVRTLSNPRISTMNNQKAIIKVGQDEFFVTDVSTTTVTGGAGSTSSPNITLTPFFSGIALDVTPQISGDDRVVLHIHPSVSLVTDQTKTVKLNGETQELPLALSTIRESDSIVRARSGQVVVIGGLMQDGSSELDSKTPLLGDIPFLGKLFQHERDINRKSELVILLRPIVVGADTWGDYTDSVTDSIDSISLKSRSKGSASSFRTSAPYATPASIEGR
jgi:MSHA biogenesis protein MshL